MNLKENVQHGGEEVVEPLSAPQDKPVKQDLLLKPILLTLTINKSVGQLTELDPSLV